MIFGFSRLRDGAGPYRRHFFSRATGTPFAPFLALGILAAVTSGAGCTSRPGSGTGAGTGAPLSLTERGKLIYERNCIACHNIDPHLKGSIGPEIYGSSLELLEARVLRAAYPDGYRPKRPDSHQMPPFPGLKNEVESLHAYLHP